MKKTLATLGMATMMVVSTVMSAFASEAPITIFGQKPVESNAVGDNTYFSAIISGTDVLKGSDIQIVDDSWRSVWWHGQDIVLSDITSEYYEPVSIDFDKEVGIDFYMQKVFVSYVPADVDVNSLGANAKFVISANGAASNTTETSETETVTTEAAVPVTQTTEKTASWAQDAHGWWIQYSDGTYMVNDWYQSPASGLWYYMGADGYMLENAWHQSPVSGLWYYLGADGAMLTNTITPDGYTVNADGVWVQ